MKLNNNLSNNASKEYKVYEDLGTVVSVLDDVVYIVGLFNGSMSEQIEFVGKELKGVINYLDNLGMVGVTVLGNSINIRVGDLVKRLNKELVTVKRRKSLFCKAKRLRTRMVTKRYLMEHLFFLKLSKEQRKEAKMHFDLLKKELDRYEKEEFSFLGKVQVYCIVVGIVNSLLSSSTGIVKNLPFILYDHLSNELQWLYLIFTAVCIIVGIILTIYMTKKKWDFVKNYELECNPRIDTKKVATNYSVKYGRGVRNRTRRRSTRHLIERFYFRNLNKEKKKAVYASLARVKKDLDAYVWSELYYIKKLQLYCFTVGIINSLLIGNTIVTKWAPFVLFQHLSPLWQFIYAGFTLFCLGLSCILRYYIYLKEVRFLDTYDYKCNPSRSVREVMVFLSSKNMVYTFLSTSAGLVTIDYMYMAATGKESLFTTLGKNVGIYEEHTVTEVYDLKSIKEAAELQQEELKDIKVKAVYEYRKEVLEKIRNSK